MDDQTIIEREVTDMSYAVDISEKLDCAKDKLFAPKCICLISQLPAVASFEQYLRQLFDAVHTKELPLESYLANLLFGVYTPSPRQSITFQCVDPITLYRPGPEDLPLFEYSFRRLFNLFSIDNFVTIYTAILLEQQIVFQSNDNALLMLVAECFNALLYPFEWKNIYVPIVPASIRSMIIQAPTIFIIGLPTVQDHELLQDKVCVSIDRGTVSVPETLPKLPNQDKITALLTEHLEKKHHQSSGQLNAFASANAKALMEISSGTSLSPSPNNPGTAEDLTFNSTVRHLCLATFVEMFVDFDTYLVLPQPLPRTPSDEEVEVPFNLDTSIDDFDMDSINFDRSAFLSDQHDGDLPFLTRFLETQMFTMFMDRMAESKLGCSDCDSSSHFARLLRKRRRMDRGNSDSLSAMMRVQQGLEVDASKQTNNIAPVPQPPTLVHHGGIVASSEREGKRAATPHRSLFHIDHPSIIHDAELKHIEAQEEEAQRARAASTPSSSSNNSLLVPGMHASSERAGLASPRSSTGDLDLSDMPRLSRKSSFAPPMSRLNHEDFAAALLADCAAKTKNCVVAATADVDSASTGPSIVSAAVLNLCQVLDRTWRHGLRESSVDSALWTFLDAAANRSSSASESLRDVRQIRGMKFLQTDVGRARAWVRLCLEKKRLGTSLEYMLQDSKLVEQLYEDYACIRQEYSDLILQHLGTLVVVEMKPFTNNTAYREAVLAYFVEIETAKGFRCGTSANISVAFRGTFAVIKPIERPKSDAFVSGGKDTFVFESRNLG